MVSAGQAAYTVRVTVGRSVLIATPSGAGRENRRYHAAWPVEAGQQDRTADLERQLAHAWAELENLGQHVHFHGLAPDDIAAIVSRNGIPASSCIREDVRHVESSSLADAADSWPAG